MDFLDPYSIFFLIIIIIFFFVFIIFYYKIKKISIFLNKLNNYHEEKQEIELNFDTFIHFSTKTLTFDGVYSLLLKYDTDLVNLNNCNFRNQNVSYESELDYDYLPKNHNNTQNDIIHINNKYIEFFDEQNYIGLSKKKYTLEHKIEYYKGDYNNLMYVLTCKRLEDKKIFIFVSMFQNFNGFLNDSKFKGLVQLIKTIKYYYKEFPYIITGNFNVQGHEEVFKELFNDALICDLKSVCTLNNSYGFASPDGLVVSNKLYRKIEYEIDFFKGFSSGHYPIIAKLYKEGKQGINNVTSNEFKEVLQYYTDHSDRNVFYNKKSIFDILKHDEFKLCKKQDIKNPFFINSEVSRKNFINI